jgi:hypothetical protein
MKRNAYPLLANLQEVMRHPYMAADGYTYEGEAFRKWLESGHDTSPITNLKLEHCVLPFRSVGTSIER